MKDVVATPSPVSTPTPPPVVEGEGEEESPVADAPAAAAPVVEEEATVEETAGTGKGSDENVEKGEEQTSAAEDKKEAGAEAVEESPGAVEPMPDAPTSPGPEVEAQPAAIGRPAHGRQPSLSIQSKMRSSSFRKGSVSQGSVSPSPGAMLKSPSLPPLSADGESVQEVYRKQSTRIEELEKDNKRLEKELEETTGRWKKTDEQLEDLREASVDVADLKDKLQKAEERVAEIDELVSLGGGFVLVYASGYWWD